MSCAFDRVPFHPLARAHVPGQTETPKAHGITANTLMTTARSPIVDLADLMQLHGIDGKVMGSNNVSPAPLCWPRPV